MQYGTANRPKTIVSTDFDNDGSLDLLTANFSFDNDDFYSMSFYKNKGDGQFIAPINYYTTPEPRSTKVADFNSDGRPDIAIAQSDMDQVMIFLNEGSNQFSTKQQMVGNSPSGLETLDVDGDGILDLAVRSTDEISILTNRGDGTFEFPIDYTYSNFGNSMMRSADFNNDNRKDLITIDNFTSTSRGSIVILLNNPAGITLHSTIDVLADVRALDVGDFNNDGHTDVAASSVMDSLYIFHGNGSGQLSRYKQYKITEHFFTNTDIQDIVSSDLNDDGHLDLVMAGDSTMFVLTGNGTGSFSAPAQHFIAMPVGDNGQTGDYIDVKDINADGNKDILVAGGNDLVVFLGHGDATFVNPVPYSISTPRTIAIEDFNMDGTQEIAVTAKSMGLSIINTGPGAPPDCSTLNDPQADNLVICHGTTATLLATGSLFYNWYAEKEGGIPLQHKAKLVTPILLETDTFYVSSSLGHCESIRYPVIARVITIPDKPEIISQDSAFCSFPAVVEYGVEEQEDVDFYSWTITPQHAGDVLDNMNPTTTIRWNDYAWRPIFETITVYARNKCGSSLEPDLYVVEITDSPTDLPKPVGSPKGCNNDSSADEFTVVEANEATSYVWNVSPAEAGIIQGTASTANVIWSPDFTGLAQVTVSGKNGCGTGTPSPAFDIGVHGAMENIPPPAGKMFVCDNTSLYYYSAPYELPTQLYHYLWTLEPADAGNVFGYERTIQIAWSDTFTGEATLTVAIDNGCGSVLSAPAHIHVGEVLAPPLPSGETNLCVNSPNTTYSIAASTLVNTYMWRIIPEEAGEISGTHNLAEVNWNDTYTGNATISVLAEDVCGSSQSSEPLTVNIQSALTGISKPQGETTLCENAMNSLYSVVLVPGATTYVWHVEPANAGEITGSGNTIQLNWHDTFSGDAAVAVRGQNKCGSSPVSESLSIHVQPRLHTPVVISGEEIICHELQHDLPITYAVEDSPAATHYQWEVNPVDAGQVTTTGKTTIEVDWSETFSGITELLVRAVNACGSSEALTMPIELGICTDVEENLSDVIKVSPNPSSGTFTIETPQNLIEGSYYELINTSGHIVKSGTIRSTSEKITFDNAVGLYLLRVNHGATSFNTRIVIH